MFNLRKNRNNRRMVWT